MLSRCLFCVFITPQFFLGEVNVPEQRDPPVVGVSTSPVASEHDTEILSPSTPQSPLFTSSFSRISPQSSVGYPSSLSRVDSEDAISVASSSSASKSSFRIPDYWPPAIMECIEQPTVEEQKRTLNTSIRNEITRALGTHLFSYNPNPTKAFCTEVARMLVKRYPFMKDTGIWLM